MSGQAAIGLADPVDIALTTVGSYTLQLSKHTPDKGSRLIAAFISETSVPKEVHVTNNP